MAWWQIATTKATRRADVAEAHARTLESTVHELRVAVAANATNRARVESVLRDAFDEPVVRDALRAFPEDADTPHADDGSVVAARVQGAGAPRRRRRRRAGGGGGRARRTSPRSSAAPRRPSWARSRRREARARSSGTRHAAACRHRAAARSAGAPGVQRRGRARVARGQTAAALRAEASSSASGRRTRPARRSRAGRWRTRWRRRCAPGTTRRTPRTCGCARRCAWRAPSEARRTGNTRARASPPRRERVAAVKGVTENAAELAERLRAQARGAARGQRARARRRGGGTRG